MMTPTLELFALPRDPVTGEVRPLVKPRIAVDDTQKPAVEDFSFLPSEGPYYPDPDEILLHAHHEYDTGIPKRYFRERSSINISFLHKNSVPQCILVPFESEKYERILKNIHLRDVDTEGNNCVITGVKLVEPYKELVRLVTQLREQTEPCAICLVALTTMQEHKSLMATYELAHNIIARWESIRKLFFQFPCNCELQVCSRMLNVTQAILYGAL